MEEIKGKQESSARTADEKYATKELKADKKSAKDATPEQFEKAVKAECKRIQRIRARASYSLFSQLYDFLKAEPGIPDILRKFYEVLDARHGFGSETNAVYAAESLEWVLKDKGEVTPAPPTSNGIHGHCFGPLSPLEKQVQNSAPEDCKRDSPMQEISIARREDRAQSILKFLRYHGPAPVGELSAKLRVSPKLVDSLLAWLEEEKRVKTADGIFWELGERPRVLDGYDFEPLYPVLVVLCGPSHSGKSTFAELSCQDCRVVSSDSIRQRLNRKFRLGQREAEVWEAFDAEKRELARAGYDIVLDACHMSKNGRKHALEGVSRRYRKICIVFDLPLSVIKERCLRAGRLRYEEAVRMWKTFEKSKPTAERLKEEGFDEVYFVRE